MNGRRTSDAQIRDHSLLKQRGRRFRGRSSGASRLRCARRLTGKRSQEHQPGDCYLDRYGERSRRPDTRTRGRASDAGVRASGTIKERVNRRTETGSPHRLVVARFLPLRSEPTPWGCPAGCDFGQAWGLQGLCLCRGEPAFLPFFCTRVRLIGRTHRFAPTGNGVFTFTP